MSEQKKLLFLTRYRLDDPFTLKFKFDSQMKAFRRLGYEVWLIGYDKTGFYLIHDNEKQFLRKTHFSLPEYEHLFFYVDFGNTILKVAKMQLGFHVAYYRESPGFFSLYRAFRKLSKFTPVICEIPTYNADGSTGEKSHGLRGLFQLYGNQWVRLNSRFFCLYALIGADNPSGLFRGRPSINIRNGIDLDSLPLRSPVQDECIHFLALGSMGKWHGFDRVIQSAAAYHGEIPFRLHLVGTNEGGCLPAWQNLTRELHAEDRIFFEGACYGEQLSHFINLCDVGISSLAAYRNGADRLYSLKLREYMARGLPVIYAADDPALETDPRASCFSLALSNDSSIPDWESILRFAIRTRQQSNLPQIIRDFAREHFTWESQFAPLLKILEQK